MSCKPYKRNCEITDTQSFPVGMSRLAMGVEYNGNYFHGFQSQSSGVHTVQQALEKVFSSICDERITLVCAGRTDRGVHATNQVIHFDTEASRPERAWLRGANTKLPRGVTIHWAQTVSPLFHARFSAVKRSYRYVIYNSPTPSALLDGQVTWDRRKLDISAMEEGSKYLLGEHDFNAFRGADCQATHAVRHIHCIDIQSFKQCIVIEIQANAFLYHMVRNIVGVLLAVASGQQMPEWVHTVLLSRDRRCADVTAPAAGLYLVEVDYPARFSVPQVSKGPFFLSSFRS